MADGWGKKKSKNCSTTDWEKLKYIKENLFQI